jgi:uncharacterized protein YjbI with pentapeptide repeats
MVIDALLPIVLAAWHIFPWSAKAGGMNEEQLKEYAAFLADSAKFNAKYATGDRTLFQWQWPVGTYAGLRISQSTFSQVDWPDGVVFRNCVFTGCVFSKGRFTRTQFIGCEFIRCTFTESQMAVTRSQNSKYEQSQFLDCEFGDFRIANSKFEQDVMRDVEFNHCRLNGILLDGVTSERMKWIKTRFENATFNDMRLSQIEVESPQIEDWSLIGCVFTKSLPDKWTQDPKLNLFDCSLEDIELEVSRDLVSRMERYRIVKSQLTLHKGLKSYGFTRIEDTRITGTEGMSEFNFAGGGVDRSNLKDFSGQRMVSGLDAKLTDSHLENLVFDEIEWDNMTFTRCTLKNIRARKSLNLDKTQFIDCKFENFTLDAGGTYSAKETPFESAPPK